MGPWASGSSSHQTQKKERGNHKKKRLSRLHRAVIRIKVSVECSHGTQLALHEVRRGRINICDIMTYGNVIRRGYSGRPSNTLGRGWNLPHGESSSRQSCGMQSRQTSPGIQNQHKCRISLDTHDPSNRFFRMKNGFFTGQRDFLLVGATVTEI